MPHAGNDGRSLWQFSAAEIVRATRAGSVSCREVIASVVERMRKVNRRLNAVTLDLGDSALRAAAELDDQRARGEASGALFGVPVTIKDNVDVRGQRTPNGVKGLANLIAPDDSPVVKNLIGAGAIIVGRTNTPEFSMRATTNNPLYGLTLNPWGAQISCGGSSGGAGVAVAVGIGAIAHGNDIGGSIRYPALHCGVAGLKPTLGRIPAWLPSANAERPFISSLMSVQGPLARSVADLRLALGAMAARDHRDPWWVPAPLAGPPAERRVGLIDDVPGLVMAPEVARALVRAGDALRHDGYEVERIEPPDFSQSGHLALRLLATDLREQTLPAAMRMGSDQIQKIFREWFAVAPPYDNMSEYLGALAARNTLLRNWMSLLERYPVLLAPQLARPLLEVDEDLRADATHGHLLRHLAPSVTVNLLGLPSVLVPTGLDAELPTGVQVIAGRYREDLCLAAAEAIEMHCGPLTPLLWKRENAIP